MLPVLAVSADRSLPLYDSVRLSYTPIPINYLTGPSHFTLNLRLAKTFGFGPEVAGRSGAQPAAALRGGGGGPRGGGGRGGGGFGAPGGGGSGHGTGTIAATA